MNYLRIRVPFARPLLACCLLALLVVPVGAQVRRESSDVRLVAPKIDDADRKAFQALHDGKQAVDEAGKKVLEKEARWLVYRLTYEEYQFKKLLDSPSDSITMKTLVDDAFKHIPVPEPSGKKPLKPEQQAFIREFAKPLIAAIKEVLDRHVPIAQVNAGIILARLGETGVEEVADAMCEVIEDKEQKYEDYVKLYALMGLKNVFKGEGIKDEKRLTTCIKDLVAFLSRKPSFDPNKTPVEEIEAFRYIRREAVRALGQSHVPALGRPKTPEVRPALDVLKFMRNEGVAPDPSLSEKVEAAIALCQMRNKLGDSYKYQPDYAAKYVAHLIVEFASEYDARRGQTSGVDWKNTALRLADALATLVADSGEKSKYMTTLTGKCTGILNSIQAGNRANQVGLDDWLKSTNIDAKELFKGMTDSAVKTETAEK